MAEGWTIAKNTFFLTAGSVVQKILAFVYFTVLARHYLTPEDVGRYLYALSYAAMFSVIVDFGVQHVIIREMAKDRSKVSAIIGNALGIKAAFAIVTAVAMFGAARLTESDPVKIALISIACITLVLDSVQLTFYAVMRAYEQLRHEALGVLIGQVITVAFGIAMLALGKPLLYLMVAYVAGSLWNAFFSWNAAQRVSRERFKLIFDLRTWREILKLSIPFALAAVFVRVYSSVDSVILNHIAGNAAAAYYGVPYKFVFAFQFIPIALAAAIYPAFSRVWQNNAQKAGDIFSEAERYLMLIVLPLTVGMTTLAEPLTVTLYKSQYLPSVAIMQTLAWCLIPAFLDYPVGALLNATRRQNVQTALMGLAMALSVILNLALVPKYGAAAAAATALTCNSLLFVGGLAYAGRGARIPWKKLLLSFLRISCASAAMGVAMVVFGGHMKLYYSVSLGVLVYLGGLFLLREIGRADAIKLRDLLSPAKTETITNDHSL